MELILVVLTAPTPEAGAGVSPQILSDILWANADPVDGLEHINVRAGPEPGSHIVGLFMVPGVSGSSGTDPDSDPDTDAASRALRACRRAVQAAPALERWTVARHSREHSPTNS